MTLTQPPGPPFPPAFTFSILLFPRLQKNATSSGLPWRQSREALTGRLVSAGIVVVAPEKRAGAGLELCCDLRRGFAATPSAESAH